MKQPNLVQNILKCSLFKLIYGNVIRYPRWHLLGIMLIGSIFIAKTLKCTKWKLWKLFRKRITPKDDHKSKLAKHGLPDMTINKLEHISKNISVVLDMCSWGGKQPRRRSEILLLEHLINKSRKSMQHTRHYGGSFVEGSEMDGSDHDTMLFLPCVSVVVNSESKCTDKGIVLLMCQEDLRPCYPTLQVLSDISEDKDVQDNIFDGFNVLDCVVDRNGKTFISSVAFSRAQFNREKSKIKIHNEKTEYMQNGPCASIECGPLMTDSVFSIECNEWPPIAHEWTSRHRQYDWPDKELIDRTIATKCSLVPLGDPLSQLCDIQWRVSFLLAERMLMWSLTRPQFYCFILLKKLKKSFIDPHHKDMISSFNLKTVLFWEMEETSSDVWTDKRLLQNVTSCLNQLQKHIFEKCMPHYFVRQNNLFSGKLTLECESEKLKSTVESLISNLVTYIHQVAKITCDFSNCLICKGPTTTIITNEHSSWFSDKIQNRFFLHFSLENILHRCTLYDLMVFKSDIHENKIDAIIMCDHKDKALKLLSVKCGLVYHKDYLNEYKLHSLNERHALLRMTEDAFIDGQGADSMCGVLHLATFYIKQGRAKDAQETIASFLDKNDVFLYDGCCSGTNRLVIIDPDIIIDDILDREADSVHDVSFFTLDYICAPDAVAFECLLFENKLDVIPIHPLVYMRFLEFLISSLLQDNQEHSLKMLEKEVLQTTGGFLREIPFNILGHCYMMFGNYEKAWACFVKSYNIRPTSKNPCVLYSLMMVRLYSIQLKTQ